MGNMFSHSTTILLSSLLLACASTPNNNYQDSFIKYDAFDEGTRLLITSFRPQSALAEVSGRYDSHYSVSVYDITANTRYLGNINYSGSYKRTQWLEERVSPGKHRLMLISNSDTNNALDDPYYSGSDSDLIDVEVVESESVIVAISKQSKGDQTRFHQLNIKPEHDTFCQNLPENHYSKRELAIRDYMSANNIDAEADNFYRLCKTLSEQKLVVASNEAGLNKVTDNRTSFTATQTQAENRWNESEHAEQYIDIYNK